jgi:hypothetical protein
MTGNITLVADGSSNLHPVTLQQLNAAVLAAAAGNLPALSGNALKFLRVNAGESSVEWAAVDLTGFQPIDADLTAIAALTSAANKVPYSTGAGTWAMADFSAAGRALVDDADNAAQRTTLGLGTIATQYANNVAITGGSVTGITDLAVADGGTGASDAAGARTNLGLGTMATQAASSVSISGGSITGITDIAIADGGTGASDAATARTNLGLAIGTNVQAYDPELAALASVTSAADALPYFTGSGTAGTTTLTSYARTLIDDADASTARTTLGLGTMATQAASSVSISGGSITGITDLAVADGGTGASTAAGAATNLGLGTGDSPQFTAVNVGHATDTTVTRVSAGRIAVEGSNVLMASDIGTSGTKIPYLDANNTFTGTQSFTNNIATTLNYLPTIASPQAVHYLHETGGFTISTNRQSAGNERYFSFNAAGTMTIGGYTVYHAGNLPGTALTWTAAQTFSTSPIKIGDGTDTIAMTGTSPILRVQGASFTTGITVRRDGFAEVGIQSASVGNVGTWTNHALNIFVNAASVAQFPTGGGMTIGGNTVYHAGNLPGTAITWTAAQTLQSANLVLSNANIAGATTGTAYTVGANPQASITSGGYVQLWGSTSANPGNVTLGNSTQTLTMNGAGSFTYNTYSMYHAGNLPGTAITWTAAQTFSAANVFSGATYPIRFSDGGYLRFFNGSSGIDWAIGKPDDTTFNIYRNSTPWLQFDGSGAGSFTFNSYSIYHSSNLPGTAITWTAAQTYGALSTWSSTSPELNWYETDGGTDAKRWKMAIAANIMYWAISNDANATFNTWLRVQRSGDTPTLIDFPTGAVEIGGTLKARIAASTETTGTLTSASANKTIQLTGDITINNSVFAAGDVVVVYAGASSRTITAGTITTMRLDGTSTTGSRTVAAYGMASIFFVSATECVVSGGSVT